VFAVSVVLAACAACCNAFSSVLQRKANRAEAEDVPFGPRMLLDVLQRPAWLGGFVAMIASFLLQATALGYGSLALVEPVLAVELPLTLVLAGWLLHRPVNRRDGWTAAAMAAGLALFLAALDPTGGSAAGVKTTAALLATGVTAAGVAALAAGAHFGPARFKAALFGAASGAAFGLTASLMKLAVETLRHHGVAAMFAGWHVYAMAVAGVVALLLLQAALHAGTLVEAQPGITLLDPLVSVLWGIVVLGERTRAGLVLILAGLGAAVLAAAVFALVRSPTLAHDR
jgi:hypothetical protein